MPSKTQIVAVLGASENSARYSYIAVKLLQANEYNVIPVNPTLHELEGLPVTKSLRDITEPVETLTLYLAAQRLLAMTGEILALKPGRVIFNPGTECPELQSALDTAGIPWQEACTLVLLRTGQF